VIHHQAVADRDFGEHLPKETVYRLVKFTHHATVEEVISDYKRAKRVRPNHRIHYLLDEPNVALDLQAKGLPAHFINQNALLDERIYNVIPAEQKQYDAVYNAWMNPFKRHLLASSIPSVAMIGGISGFIGQGEPAAYARSVKQGIPGAYFVNLDSGKFLSDAEVAQWVNRARVGLCLSAFEGGMYAATEYLLCGLPVVSTVNRGGRDIWFDPSCARTVSDTPEAVAQAVSDLIALNLNPLEIRQRTLQKVWEHRRRLIDLVQSIFDSERAGRDYGREFYARFTTKLGHWRALNEIWKHRETDCR
jgi:hypothetical protein